MRTRIRCPDVPCNEAAKKRVAVEIGRLCPDVWISLGSRGTAFNFYATGGKQGDAIVAGVSGAGRVWTDVKGLGSIRANQLAAALRVRGVSLDTRLAWVSWRRSGRPFHPRRPRRHRACRGDRRSRHCWRLRPNQDKEGAGAGLSARCSTAWRPSRGRRRAGHAEK